MNPCFYLVTFRRDLPMAVWAVRALIKNMTGPYSLAVGVPDTDLAYARELLAGEQLVLGARLIIFSFREPPGRGFNTHQMIECCADLWAPGFSHYIHVDSDCLLRVPLDISIFFEGGCGIWYFQAYSEIIPVNANLRHWAEAVRSATGESPCNEYMRCFPIVIPACVYSDTRALVEAHTRRDFAEYVIACKNSYPQTFAEYNTLGFVAESRKHPVAWRHFKQLEPVWGPGAFAQFWTHGGVDFVMPDGPSMGLSARRVARELGVE